MQLCRLSQRHTWRFYTPIAANLIASEIRKRFSLAIDADTPGDFFAVRGDVAVLKAHVLKSPNLMGWLYWRFAAINVENRGNGHTWRMPANLIAIAAAGTPDDFRRSRRSAYKIAKCVAGFTCKREVL